MLKPRNWVPKALEDRIEDVSRRISQMDSADVDDRLHELVEENRTIHERDCFNLNPATNVMNPRAEALLATGLGSRPSLGYPFDKYEMGLEAIEEIEIMAATLAAEVFDAGFAEIRVPSGAIGNLYAFMATCKPGDAIIVPPAAIGGHVTHHDGGCAGLYGLDIHHAPVADNGYSVDIAGLRALAKTVSPTLITIGGSLNLDPHPVAEIRAIADEVGALVLFDAAHQCGLIAAGTWPNPLTQGAHLMTMSTYKSLGGPAGGLIVTNDAELAERLDAIAFPGMTANFDAAKSAALALTLLDWREFGAAYGAAMVEMARALATALDGVGVEVFRTASGFTQSHQFAVLAAPYGGGQTASRTLRQAGFLACGIGLPAAPVQGDLNGLRMGTPELVRWGMGPEHCDRLADLIRRGLETNNPARLAEEVAEWRRSFATLHFVRKC